LIYKELFSTAAIALTFIAFLPYIRSILQGITRPHVFTWVIWGAVTFVVFLAQLADGGGVGAWPIGVSGMITLYVAFLAFTGKSDTTITRTDWLFLLFAMTSLPFWYFTSDPLWAVVILTAVDVSGFGPALRKALIRPFEEKLAFYMIIAVRNIFSMVALEHYSLTTVLFPAVTAIVCLLFALLVANRRRRPAG
jgi:hypothetical protein